MPSLSTPRRQLLLPARERRRPSGPACHGRTERPPAGPSGLLQEHRSTVLWAIRLLSLQRARAAARRMQIPTLTRSRSSAEPPMNVSALGARFQPFGLRVARRRGLAARPLDGIVRTDLAKRWSPEHHSQTGLHRTLCEKNVNGRVGRARPRGSLRCWTSDRARTADRYAPGLGRGLVA
jgi:hypothetical protein